MTLQRAILLSERSCGCKCEAWRKPWWPKGSRFDACILCQCTVLVLARCCPLAHQIRFDVFKCVQLVCPKWHCCPLLLEGFNCFEQKWLAKLSLRRVRFNSNSQHALRLLWYAAHKQRLHINRGLRLHIPMGSSRVSNRSYRCFQAGGTARPFRRHQLLPVCVFSGPGLLCLVFFLCEFILSCFARRGHGF